MKIESGFGEKLRHLDEAYKGMSERFDRLPSKLEIKDAKKELKQEEQEMEKILKEREQLIDELVSKAQLQEGEKEKFLEELESKERALQEARQEIHFLRNRLQRSEQLRPEEIDSGLINYIRNRIINKLGPEIAKEAPIVVRKRFRRMIDELPKGFIVDLSKHGLLDEEGNLTKRGLEIFRKLAEELPF